MWLDELYIQRLQRIEMTEPWPAAGPGLLAGAITLVFERDAVMCSSPLRYSHCQQGTVTAMFDGGTRGFSTIWEGRPLASKATTP